MKTGDTVRIWPEGDKSRMSTGKIMVASEDGRSLAIGFGDPARCINATKGVAVHPEHGVMLLLHRDEEDTAWTSLFHGERYEIKELNGKAD